MLNIDVDRFLSQIDWSPLTQILGSSHSSIIEFLTTEWLKKSPQNRKVLDGAHAIPSDGEKKGRVHADLVLVENNEPKFIVEVETVNWLKKVDSIC